MTLQPHEDDDGARPDSGDGRTHTGQARAEVAGLLAGVKRRRPSLSESHVSAPSACPPFVQSPGSVRRAGRCFLPGADGDRAPPSLVAGFLQAARMVRSVASAGTRPGRSGTLDAGAPSNGRAVRRSHPCCRDADASLGGVRPASCFGAVRHTSSPRQSARHFTPTAMGSNARRPGLRLLPPMKGTPWNSPTSKLSPLPSMSRGCA